MPTYDYICKECDHEFELFQGIHDDVVKSCPECSGLVRRIISGGAGIIFKGSGFYVTDNKTGESNSNSVANSKSEAPKQEKVSEKKKETAKSDKS
ncbi:MAG: zinc ribbon domain-containing protein [Bacteroidetes bacterium]|nr:zinc ribbon domain-containing protein [Bacteroidota bacterium]